MFRGKGGGGKRTGTDRGSGRGRMGRMGGGGPGSGGFCICNKCGHRERHQAGIGCMEIRCPKCNTPLVREGGFHDRKAPK